MASPVLGQPIARGGDEDPPLLSSEEIVGKESRQAKARLIKPSYPDTGEVGSET